MANATRIRANTINDAEEWDDLRPIALMIMRALECTVSESALRSVIASGQTPKHIVVPGADVDVVKLARLVRRQVNVMDGAFA
jgi:hypothetical protein